MEDIFIKLLNMSITASYFAVAVMLIRIIFRKIPKWISCILWGLVGIRLVFPFSFESVLSLIPSAETVPEDIMFSSAPHITSGIPAFNSTVNPIINEAFAPEIYESANPMQIVMFILSALWITGVMGMLIYALVSYIILRKKTAISLETEKGVFICDSIDSPFILGLTKPSVFIPSYIGENDSSFILAHEKAHIKRKDYLWKPLGFLILSVHWFNPVIWAAYIFLCRDIETACDERVIKEMAEDSKKAYSEALINCSAPKKYITACPLAFGETGVKQRIKNVLNYKKPAFWVIIISVIVSIILSVCFMSNPTGMKLTDIDGYGYIFDNVEKIQLYIGSGYIYTTEDTKPEISEIKKVRLEKTPVEDSTDKSFRIEINDEVSININEDFSVLWIDDGTRLSYTYKIKNPEILKNLFSISNYATGMNGICITLENIKQTDTDITFTVNWHNERNETVEYGEMYTIEKYIGEGQYEKVPFPENFVFLLPAYMLKPGDVIEKEYYCPMTLEDGHYRFSTTFRTEDGNNYNTSAGFYIGDEDNRDDHLMVNKLKNLTLDDVIMLSKEKGKDLSWIDFEDYTFYETGSGLYIRLYKIDERFSLSIGGVGTDSAPTYIYLNAVNASAGKFIDIRGDDVEKFIEENKNNPIPETELSFGKRIFPVDNTGNNLNRIVEFGATVSSQMVYSHLRTFPVVTIENEKELDRFSNFFEDIFDYDMVFEDTGFSFSQVKDLYKNEYKNFFDKYTLLLVYASTSNENNRFDVLRLIPDGDRLSINIRENRYEDTASSTATGWLIVLEVDKEQLKQNQKFIAFIGESVNLPEPEVISSFVLKNDTEDFLCPNFHLYDNGTYMLSPSVYSSYLGRGEYKYEGDLLILTSREEGYCYTFEVNNGYLVYKKDASIVHPSFNDIPDKAQFTEQ